MAEEKKKRGRSNRADFLNWFDQLCALEYSPEEMCAFLGVSMIRLKSWCRQAYGWPLFDVMAYKKKEREIARELRETLLAKMDA